MAALHLTDLEWEAISLSLRVALVSVVGSLPFGLAFAWLLARRTFPGKWLVDGLRPVYGVVLPLVFDIDRARDVEAAEVAEFRRRYENALE